MTEAKQMKVLEREEIFKAFPTLPRTVPYRILNANWAEYIHSQTLDRLNERGGMSVLELLMNIKRITFQKFMEKGYNQKVSLSDVDELLKLINKQP